MTLLYVLSSFGCSDSPRGAGAPDAGSDSGHEPAGAPLGRLRVHSGKLVDGAGNPIVLQGLGLGAINEVNAIGHWDEDYFAHAGSWNAAVVRLPVNPVAYQNNPTQTLADLDSAVAWCKRSNLYLIIDYQVTGNVEQGLFFWSIQQSCTWQDMEAFWTTVAARYANEPTVAFYEIYNEPGTFEDAGGTWTFAEWRAKADALVALVRRYSPDTIPLLSGFNFDFDFSAGGDTPFDSQDIALSAPPYPGSARYQMTQAWDAAFGYLADRYPIVFTEVGFDPYDLFSPTAYRADLPYGRQVLGYARDKQISWTAFALYLNPNWPMPLFSDWATLAPTVSGAFFKDVLAGVDLSIAGDGFGPRPAVVEPTPNGPGGMSWGTYAHAGTSAQWNQQPSTARVSVHIDPKGTAQPGTWGYFAPNAPQAGMWAYLKCDGAIVDATGFNEVAFDGNIAQGQVFSFGLGRWAGNIFTGCAWNLTGKGAANYVVDLLHPDACVPTTCFDMQVAGVNFGNALIQPVTSMDVEVDSFELRTNPANPLAAGGQIGNAACP